MRLACPEERLDCLPVSAVKLNLECRDEIIERSGWLASSQAFAQAQIPSNGVGLARSEFGLADDGALRYLRNLLRRLGDCSYILWSNSA